MKCPVRGCGGSRQPHQLCCRKHWFKLPRTMQQEVYELFASGKKWDHRKAAYRAIRWLSEREEPHVA